MADNETGKANLRKYFITKQEPDENGTMEPSDAVSKIDRVEDAEKAMNTAGLLQLPFVIKQLSELKTISREKEKENSELESKINDLKSEIATANKPVLFVEWDNDAKLFNATLARLGVKDDIVIKILGTAPSKKEDLLKRIMDQGGLSTNQKSMFLFDNDQAGRKAARTLCDNIDTISQANFPNGFVGLLPHTDEFKAFIGRHQINADQAFFTAEFLFPAEDSARLCHELIKNYNGSNDLSSWDKTLNGQYWNNKVNRITYHDLLNTVAGQPDWFYARGVPECLKSSFNRDIVNKDCATEFLDNYMTQVIKHLK